MVEELFESGNLELPVSPVFRPEAIPSWSDCIVNRILVIAAVLLFLLFFNEIIRMLPKFRDCVLRTNHCQNLERNLGEKRSRDMLAFLAILPFCIIADRYSLYRCRFLSDIDPEWGVASCAGVVLIWLCLHILVWGIAQNTRGTRPGKELLAAAHHIIYNYFPVLVIMMVGSLGAMEIFSVPDTVISSVLRWEVIVGYMFSTLRFVRFLLLHCSALSTFLYLCTLEFLPASFVVVGEVV